jgi:hypothetical protein
MSRYTFVVVVVVVGARDFKEKAVGAKLSSCSAALIP